MHFHKFIIFQKHRKVYINTTSNSKINVQWKSKIQKTNHLEIYTSDDTYSWRISRTRFGCSENVVAFGDFYENLLAGFSFLSSLIFKNHKDFVLVYNLNYITK